jgi:hypothetical protein
MNKLEKIINNLKNLNYLEYCNEFKLFDIFEDGEIEDNSFNQGKWDSVTKDNDVPLPGDLKDLVRLHSLVRTLKARVILEFGLGKSTRIFVDAMGRNKYAFKNHVENELRISNPFTLHSVDNSEHWIEKTKEKINSPDIFFPYFSKCIMGEFNGRICTFYDNLPNLRPDFIYLDAPSQFGVMGEIRGISTEHSDRMPMSADLLAIEYFLEPGTFIIVDGRTANARFLRNNFQRNWLYEHVEEFDQHFFYLDEAHLGKWNLETLKFVEL